MDKATKALNKGFADFINRDPTLRRLMNDFAKGEDEWWREAAKNDPVKHRLTLRMDGHAGYTYFDAGCDGRGVRVRFCYSKNRNAAGYYLVWRQRESKRYVRRDQWDSSTSKASAVSTAKDMFDRFKAERAKTET
jgi:hypothetical protein